MCKMMNENHFEAVILADGDFPVRQEQLTLLRTAPTLICCDGAANSLLDFDREPDRIVGDLDSLSEQARKRFADRVTHVTEQESNDLAKAFRCTVEAGISSVAVLGAGGGREDHLLGNLSQFAAYSLCFSRCELFSANGIFRVMRGTGEFSARPGDQISIFSFDPSLKITSQNLRYPLNGTTLPWWHSGTLNEVTANHFSLTADKDAPILLFFAYRDIEKTRKRRYI